MNKAIKKHDNHREMLESKKQHCETSQMRRPVRPNLED